MKKYQITVSEEQLRLIASAVEDWHRFLAGQCDMHNAVLYLDNYYKIRTILKEIEQFIPLCDWAGNGAEYNNHRKAIAMSYSIYREIYHYFAMQQTQDILNVYQSETLTCADSGELIKIKQIFEDSETIHQISPMEYIDLELPSGTLWATKNKDDYFQYDEIIEKNSDNLPTKEQWQELLDYTTYKWTIVKGEKGYKFTAKNGNSIFLPAAGYRDCNGSVYYVGSNGYYWSSTPKDSDYAWGLYFYFGRVHMNYSYRRDGISVRLVKNK